MSAELPPVRLALWRDRDPEAMRIPGMYLGEVAILGDPRDEVARLAAEGACLARLHDPIDLSTADADTLAGAHADTHAEPDSRCDGAAAVAGLVVVRELTGHGIAVDWTLRPPARPWDWRPLGHLHPPAAVLDGDPDGDVATGWEDAFHPAKFGYRHGPGFIEIRDHRTDPLRRLVIRNPRYDRVIEPLLRGVAATGPIEAMIARYERAGLVHRVGRYAWWTPYRVRRNRRSPHDVGTA